MAYIFSPKKSFSRGDSEKKKRLSFPIFKKWNWRLFWKVSGALFAAGFLFVAGVFAWFAKDLPSPGKINSRFVAESTKIYDRTGKHVLYEVHGEEKRTQIPFSEMPEVLRYATLALEDSEFYSHRGIKFSSIGRAVLKDLKKGTTAQGGSTITQQLIKNSLLTSERTFTRKIKEVILAIELEQKFEKDEILEMYLNQIPYGSNAYGIEAAAQTFFGKHAKELDLSESALLASLPQAPSRYSPHGSYPEVLKARQEFALDRMARLGYITQEQADEAKQVDILARVSPYRGKIEAPHFVMYVKEQIEKKYGEHQVEQGGLKVYTTLDYDLQKLGERVVREGAEKNTKTYRAENASLVAIDPKNGQILTMVGSKDYFDKSIDGQVNVAVRDRQPGSSFKPFVYLSAFEKGYTPETILWDVDTEFDTGDGKSYNPKNYDGKNSGPVKMKEALARSLNVPAVKALYLAGVKDSITTAKKLGISTLNNPDRYGLSLVLGGGEVKLLEHTGAYATLASGGTRHPIVSVLRVENSKGEILEENKPASGERVVEEKYVAMISHILSENNLRAPVFGERSILRFDDRQVAVKTGTTNEWRDGWTMGYTPTLAVGVWAGNNNNSVMAPGADGSYVAAPIWRSFIQEAIKNHQKEKFSEYEPEETGKAVLDGKMELRDEIKVCKIPGEKNKYCLASSFCPDSLVEKKKFSSAHSILYFVQKDDPRGDAPEKPESDPQFRNWEKAVLKWVEKEKDYETDAPPKEECREKDFEKFKPEIQIISPLSGETITSENFTISVKTSAPYGVKKISLEIAGQEVYSSDKSEFDYKYDIPGEKKQGDIEILVRLEDKIGNKTGKNISIQTNLP